MDGDSLVADAASTPLEGNRRNLWNTSFAAYLMTSIQYGSGLRLAECLEIRAKDIDLQTLELTVRDGKGAKDRHMMIPQAVARVLRTWNASRSSWGRPPEMERIAPQVLSSEKGIRLRTASYSSTG